MVDAAPVIGAAEQAADRAAANTVLRMVAELVGKFASLALVFVLARRVGAEGLGVYVFAIAWSEVANLPVDMGFDRYLTRRVAVDRRSIDALLGNVVCVKLMRAAPAIALSFVLVNLLGYGSPNRDAVYAAAAALLFDSLTGSVVAVFMGLERGGLIAVVLVAQRILAAALGLAALAAGLGVVWVLVGFAVATVSALALAVVLLLAFIGRPRLDFSRAGRKEASSRTLGFAAQEVLSAGLARADAILLSLLGTTAAVGIYGAGYRLLESTLFIPLALTAAFAAMFTYLTRNSRPSVSAVYGYAVKAAVILLAPVAVTLFVLAPPVLRLFFGDGFAGAVTPLRVIAPVVVLLGVVLVSVSLVISRRDPRPMAWAFGGALLLNIVANLVLIPPLGPTGAALSMLITEGLFAVVGFGMAVRAVGRPPLGRTFGAPLLAAAAMALVMALLDGVPIVAGCVGVIAYLAVLIAVEWRFYPADLRFAADMLRRRLAAPAAAR